MFDILQHVEIDQERTDEHVLRAHTAAEKEAKLAFADAVLEGYSVTGARRIAADARQESIEQATRTFYVVRSNDIYPAVIAHIRECMECPHQVTDDDLKRYTQMALQINPKGWEIALIDRSSFPDNAIELKCRTAALEIARWWFSHELRLAAGTAIAVHILKDERYRL